MKTFLTKLLRDESGTETLEYALILGLILVATIGIIGAFGTRAVARWNSANGSL